MPASIAVLDDRAVITLEGADARDLLQRLVTNDVERLETGQARYAALLTPQGKIITDFFVVAGPTVDFLLDVPLVNAADLARKLNLYKLRAKVVVAERADLGVVVAPSAPSGPVVAAYADPRREGLWPRAILDRATARTRADPRALTEYRALLIRAGVPEGGVDYPYGETFPHDANLDHLNGVDFRKGCYVGQEVVSRVEHRGTARRRIVPAAFDGPAPPRGSEISAEGMAIGIMGGAIDGLGLALVRVDRVAAASGPITAANVPLRLAIPAWAQPAAGRP